MENLTQLLIFLAILAVGVGYWYTTRTRLKRRKQFIDDYQWPAGLTDKFLEHYPELKAADSQQAGDALRQFFKACLMNGCRLITMPSRSADVFWHEFILDTRSYEAFCQQAFGRFLHHAAVKETDKDVAASNIGLRRIWNKCCRLESMNPHNASRLPLLFAVDSSLNIADGVAYDLETMNEFAAIESQAGSGCGAGI